MIRNVIVITLGASLLAGCGKGHQPTRREVPDAPDTVSDPHAGMAGDMEHMVPATIDDPEVNLGSMRMTAPDNWTRKPPRSRILLAEFSLPGAKGDYGDGRLTVTAVGGSVEDNVVRWKQQFGNDLKQESLKQVEITGVQVALVDLRGTYNEQHMPMAPPTQLADYRMRAAIFSVTGRQFIVKCYGPEKTMADQEDEFMAFLQSLKSPKPESSEPGPVEAEPSEPPSDEQEADAPVPDRAKDTEPESTEPESSESAG